MNSLASHSRPGGSLTCLACTLDRSFRLRHLDGADRHRRYAIAHAGRHGSKAGVRVSAAVLGPEDCVRMLGRT